MKFRGKTVREAIRKAVRNESIAQAKLDQACVQLWIEGENLADQLGDYGRRLDALNDEIGTLVRRQSDALDEVVKNAISVAFSLLLPIRKLSQAIGGLSGIFRRNRMTAVERGLSELDRPIDDATSALVNIETILSAHRELAPLNREVAQIRKDSIAMRVRIRKFQSEARRLDCDNIPTGADDDLQGIGFRKSAQVNPTPRWPRLPAQLFHGRVEAFQR